MSFAAQLAARAEEKRRPPRSRPSLSSSPPRPRNIASRGRIGGPPPHPGKIPKTPDGRRDGGGASRPGRFAAQLRRGSGSLNRRNRSLPDLDISSSSTRSTPSTLPAHSMRRKSLLPTDSARKSCEEEDEYDDVGFSLMSVPSAVSASSDDRGGGGEGGVGSPPPTPKASQGCWAKSPSTTPPSPNEEQHIAVDSAQFQGKDLSPIAAMGRREYMDSSLSSSSSSLPHSLSSLHSFSSLQSTVPGQQRTDPELQSKLQRQLLKCQTQSESALHVQRHEPASRSGADAMCHNYAAKYNGADAVRAATSSAASGEFLNDGSERTPPGVHGTGGKPDNTIFGAWAEIESLQRRCREAEDRARRERERAEIASYELSLVKERKERGQRREGGATQDSIDGVRSAPSTEKSKEDVTMAKRDDKTAVASDPIADETTIDVDPVASASANVDQGSAQIDVASVAGATADVLQWKKRALEAEERLSRAAAVAPLAPAQAPPSRPEEESPDLIRLKNAEIDVLRHQVRRLELRAREERARNDDLLRAPSYLDGRLDGSLASHLAHLDDDHPAVVVAPECVTAASCPTPPSAAADVDELRLLRSEIRHLQYQLRTGKAMGNSGTNQTSAYSTTGESTLSSLGEDGNGNYIVKEDGGGEVEEEDGNNVSTSSNSSLWGLCCVRRSRRGYGRV